MGSSYLPSDVLAALLYGQLAARAEIESRRRQIWDRYASELGDWAATAGVTLPVVPQHCLQTHHLFYLLMPSEADRDRLIHALAALDILAVFHYLPLHLSEMGRRFGGRAGLCPVTEDVSARLVRLPFYTTLTEKEQDEIVAAVRDFPVS